MNQTEMATSFLKMVAAKKIEEAYQSFIALDFIHHNQYFKGDRESLKLAMQQSGEMNPNKVFSVKQVHEAENTVVTYSHVRQKPEDLGAVVVHIFRFENNKIVELWDVGQALIQDSPNENGVF